MAFHRGTSQVFVVLVKRYYDPVEIEGKGFPTGMIRRKRVQGKMRTNLRTALKGQRHNANQLANSRRKEKAKCELICEQQKEVMAAPTTSESP